MERLEEMKMEELIYQLHKQLLLQPSIKELRKISERERKIEMYKRVEWNGGEGIWGSVIELRKQQELRIKQRFQDYVQWVTKGKVRPRVSEIKVKWITPLGFKAIMAQKLGFTYEEKVKIFERDGWKCVECGCEMALHAHHKIPKSVRPDLAHDVRNGITLCAKCHAKVHEAMGTPGWQRLKEMAERQMAKAKETTRVRYRRLEQWKQWAE